MEKIFRNILTNTFDDISYKDKGIEKRVSVIDILERLSDWRYDIDVADELGVKVVTIRKLLNELHEVGLVTYKRTKNKETGWYTYIWKMREDKSSNYANEYLNLDLSNLRSNLEYAENNIWFDCSCSRVTLNEAMESNFMCPDCSETFIEAKVSDKIKKIESDIRKIRDMMILWNILLTHVFQRPILYSPMTLIEMEILMY